MHRFPSGHPVEDGAVDRLPAGQGAVAGAPHRLLGIGMCLEQATDPALRVVDRGGYGMITVNPIASTAGLVSGLSFIAALMALALGLGIT
ncbi:hypothetical protein DLREEDagr8_12760 [Dongia sp. agr-C8]